MRTILANESIAFEKFVRFIASDSQADANFQEIVGEFDDDDDQSIVDYGALFDLYGRHVGGWCPWIIDEDAAHPVAVSSASLCAAGAVLPLGKMITYIGRWIATMAKLPGSAEAICRANSLTVWQSVDAGLVGSCDEWVSVQGLVVLIQSASYN